MNKGKLYLIPTVIAEDTESTVISPHVKDIIAHLDYYLVENARTARRYISKLKLGLVIEDLHFDVLDKKTSNDDIASLLKPLMEGKDIGVLSESGCPGIADPGALAVKKAHELAVQVIPLSGPSSIFMALMASGFNGQSFTFHGYVPIDHKERTEKIRSMEKSALQLQQTQLFMDTPYRNQKLFEDVIKTCHANTSLSVARDVTGKSECIKTMTIAEWRRQRIDLHKIPTIFSLFG